MARNVQQVHCWIIYCLKVWKSGNVGIGTSLSKFRSVIHTVPLNRMYRYCCFVSTFTNTFHERDSVAVQTIAFGDYGWDGLNASDLDEPYNTGFKLTSLKLMILVKIYIYIYTCLNKYGPMLIYTGKCLCGSGNTQTLQHFLPLNWQHLENMDVY